MLVFGGVMKVETFQFSDLNIRQFFQKLIVRLAYVANWIIGVNGKKSELLLGGSSHLVNG